MEKFKYNGHVVYDMEPDIWKRMYGTEEILPYLCRTYTRVGIEKEDGLILTNLAIKRLIGVKSKGEWYEFLARYTCMPNGQVKNFMVACRTYLGGFNKVKICIRGSKSGQGGGIWHIYYGSLLLRQDIEVTLDCYDDCEVEDSVVYSLDGKKLIINWIPRKYVGNASEYDVFIDDAWVPGTGVQRITPHSKVWSLKGLRDDVGYEPFLHPQETRCFSAPPNKLEVECKCMLCNACAASVHNYNEYVNLRALCSTFGHTAQCLAGSYAHYDMVVKGDVLRHVLTHPSYTVSKPAEMRAAVVLQNELPLQFPTAKTLQYDPTQEGVVQKLKHKEGFIRTSNVEVYKWLEGKRIAFFGVAPSILGSTRIQNIRNTASLTKEQVDVGFYSTVSALEMSSCSPLIYLPKYQDAPKCWTSTGRYVSIYAEYEYVQQMNDNRAMYYSYHDGLGWRRQNPISIFEKVQDGDNTRKAQLRRLSSDWKLVGRPMQTDDIYVSVGEWKFGVFVLRQPILRSEDPSSLFWRSDAIGQEYGIFSSQFWTMDAVRYCKPDLLIPSKMMIPASWSKLEIRTFDECSIYEILRATKEKEIYLDSLAPEVRSEWHVVMNHDMFLHDCFPFDIIKMSLLKFNTRKYG